MDENKEIPRRSSILKPRKARNPLGDVEECIIDYDKENDTTIPKPRRVSFASNNLVKQFATDEEKNTIWDSTYEETADGSSQASPPTLNPLQSLINSTKTNIIYDENMDFTEPVGFVQERVQENPIQSQKMFTTLKDSNSDDNLDLTLPVGYNILEDKGINQNKTIIGDVEITTDLTLPNNLNFVLTKNLNQTASNMSFTQAVGGVISLKNPLIEKKGFNETGNNMSFTQAVDGAISLKNPLIEEKGFNQTGNNMSFTQAVGGAISLKNPLIEEKGLNQTANNMSFTQAVGGAISLKNPLIEEKGLNQTANNMSFTQAVGGVISLKNPLIEEKRLNQTGNNMSFTQAVGGEILLKNLLIEEEKLNYTSNNMSFTQAVGDYNENDVNSVDPKDLVNSEISLINPLIDEENKKINTNQTAKNKSFRQAITNQTIGDELNLEISINPSMEEMDQEKSFNRTSTNNISLTEVVAGINFECSLKNPLIVEDNQSESKSEFSRIAAGDLFPSFSKLKSMPLGEGLNPSEFEVSLSELKSVENTQEPSLIDSTLESSLSKLNLELELSERTEKIVEKEELRCTFDVKKFQEKLNNITRNSKKMDLDTIRSKIKRHNELTENFKKWYEQNKIIANQSVESIISVDEDVAPKIESIKTIIQSIEKDNKRFWQLLSIENDQIYKFSTLYGSINLEIVLKENSDEVVDLIVIDKIRDDVAIDAAYVQKVFIKKLALDRIKSALGIKFDIRSLLDFVRGKMLEQREFMKEFERLTKEFRLIMDENYRVIYNECVPRRKIAWRFFIHMCQNDFQPDKNVTFFPLLPDVVDDVNMNERRIEKIIKTCSSGISFIQDFIDNVRLLITNLK